MSSVLVLWLMCGFLANLPTAFSRPKWLIDGSGSRIKADESVKRQSSSGCGSYNYLNNTLASPGYPSNYPSYMDCEYQVPIPSGKAMRINFHHFNVEYHGSCRYDYLEITNDRNQTFGKYCGDQNGFFVDVSGDYVVLKFHSDSSVVYSGYLLSFTAFSNGTQSPPTSLPTVPPTTASGCGSYNYLNNTLASPGYPFNYPNNIDCYYQVPIPSGKAMRINFDQFHLEGGLSCSYDYLEITNDRNQTVGKYCGLKSGFYVDVSGDYVVLKFHSDSSFAYTGYLLSFTAFSSGTQSPPTSLPTVPPTTAGGCGSYNYLNNTLASPGYPLSYPNNLDCYYQVPIPSGKAMRINFDHFALEYHYSCRYDYLEITNDRNQTFGKHCGFKHGFYVDVSGDYVVLKFHSDASGAYTGYLLSFTAFSNGTQSPPTSLPPVTPTTAGGLCGFVQNNQLVSPGYPNNYPHNTDCNYTVYIPYGKALQIYFYVFRVNDCGYDYLKISNLQNQTFGSYCGTQTGKTVTVTGAYAVLTFHSDGIFNDQGYKLFFSYVSQGIASTAAPYTTPPYQTTPPTSTPSGCGYVQYNELKSPGYPGNYPNGMNCVYWIYISHGMALKVDFEFFEISDCWFDYVKITNEHNQTFGTFCGNHTGQVVYVSGHYAVVTFHSDSIVSGKGYKLKFSSVYQVNVSTPAPWPTYTTYPTYPTFTSPSKPFPSFYPSMDPKCKLRTYIQILARLLYEMDNIVRYELNSNFSAREYKARVKRALSDVQTAMSKGGRHRRDVKKVQMIDELERKAAELLKRLDTKEAQSKMRVLLNKKMAEKN